ncbi:hypothetical protein K466DRAFT_516936 [Polyporus arcularius HHB13444]|uniref:Uncharacterized protein n=1 Tax=Polyporus arcularius HHB13444 TaxID=1314778 RepID=A0A5C3PWY9_9APHY|nr:hypothetical protein K466DRAFT_516936 [Polyporus arcularius HHB13444]
MKLFLWVLREAGVKDAPTFHYLRTMQAKIRELCGIPTIPCRSPMGNVFWMVDVRAVLAKDYSNRDTRAYLQVYPEILEDGSVSEVYHASKWLDADDLSVLSPMYDAGSGYHFYVNEVTLCTNGDLVVPYRWIVYHGEVHADSYPVVIDEEKRATIDRNMSRRIPVRALAANYFDLEHRGGIPHWVDDEDLPEMPNPLRKIAGGDPLYSSFVNHFADDVSGNRSKSWNKHLNAYFTHANLPRRFLQQESHVHFLSTSPHASAAEQFHGFKTVVESTHTQPVRVHDALTGQFARFRVFVNAEPSDNPMQSEISGHIGGNGNFFCRKCDVGGNTESKETDHGFHCLFHPGQPRTRQGILDEVKRQVYLACSGVEKPVKVRQRETGVKDAYTQYWIDDLIKRARAMKQDHPELTEDDIRTELISWADANADKIYNPFFTLRGLDPTRDTPVEILHTVLLGVVKYVWHWSHTSWTAEQKKTYSIRLQATDSNGLTIHAIRANYIMQYANSLIGRQLKTVAQATVFHVYDLLPDSLFDLWVAIGHMTALIWFPVIRDKEMYKGDLRVAIANVLDAFAAVDPSKILAKIKLHLLVHAPEDIDRFGPLIAMCTELFEKFNGTFRYASIHSNHQAPSRDIARELADQESLRHRLTGGTWLDRGDWQRAGPRVLDFLRENPNMQGLVGWCPDDGPEPGSYRLAAVSEEAKERPTIVLRNTAVTMALNNTLYDLDETYTLCKYVVSQAGDICAVGTWVCSQSPIQPDTVLLGRIAHLLAHPADKIALVVLDIFEVGSTQHPKFRMPVLARRYGEASYVIVKSQDLRFNFNVQHDCKAAGCSATGTRHVSQERQQSERTEAYIEHRDLQRFIINLHSLHNPHLIRSVLPRELTTPVPQTEELRREQHDKNAHSLRVERAKKKAAANAKKAKKAANKVASQRTASKNKQARTSTQRTAAHGAGGVEMNIADDGGGNGEDDDRASAAPDRSQLEGRKRRRIE